jgi:hypothetical protein
VTFDGSLGNEANGPSTMSCAEASPVAESLRVSPRLGLRLADLRLLPQCSLGETDLRDDIKRHRNNQK